MKFSRLYQKRKLLDGYPDLEELSSNWFSDRLEKKTNERNRVNKLLVYLNRLTNMELVKTILVLGCGPRPEVIKILNEKGYEVTGIDPIISYVKNATLYLENQGVVKLGAAEYIPLPDDSQNIVFFESVLEHVDSPLKSLQEIYRILMPGGIAVISTTNRYRISLSGRNGEYNVPFFNWFPKIVKESFIFHHLHYEPTLANYTPRPAVHWFSFADLCSLGRMAGFAQFYSILDLVDKSDPSIVKSKLRTFMIEKIKYNPWLRALILTQFGSTIIMWKRMENATTHPDGWR
ncbi:MAG: class I SAM-dependent methyltransferase [Chloroflexota bacterium]